VPASKRTVLAVIVLFASIISFIAVSSVEDRSLPQGWVPLNQQMSALLEQSETTALKQTLEAPQAASVSQTKVNINRATVKELTVLPGIGDAKAKAIVTYRQESGLFAEPADIMKVKGIGEKMFEKLKDRITAEP
jgi:competence protein ComEA